MFWRIGPRASPQGYALRHRAYLPSHTTLLTTPQLFFRLQLFCFMSDWELHTFLGLFYLKSVWLFNVTASVTVYSA
jgi:hypothetical protein